MAFSLNRVAAQDDIYAETEELDDISPDARRIGDIAKEFGISLRTLRFYEDKGMIAPERVGSTRLYHHRDIARLKLILLGRKVGFSLREVKQLMDLYDRNGTNIRQMKAVIERSTRQLARLEKQRVELDSAIETLGEVLTTTKDKLATVMANRAS